MIFTVLFSCKGHKSIDEISSLIATKTTSNYVEHRLPLKESPYLELPLGAIKPNGWLREQLQVMASGMTGNLDNIYPEVVGPRNGW
ncbi:hypothetical protein [Maribacter sp. ACAM166]|uniref:hypothetical protein n=1 Tax=Maribacter sp. ACAM166 TaxID=2508996 RepID=UPI001BB19E8A|nr:hypothetical protein [Maribacter sp. ACAM166]